VSHNHPQKIIIIGPAHPLRPGGITTFNERLCKAFTDVGHDCSIWSFSLQYPSFLFPGSSQFTDGPAPANINIITAINSVNPLNWIRVGNRIREDHPDIVVVRYWIPVMGPCLGTILRIIRKNKHTKIICIADNIKPHESRPGDSMFTRFFVKPVHRFIVMSEQVLKDLKIFTDAPATLLPHPLYDNFGEAVDINTARKTLAEKYELRIAPEDNVLLFFGLIRQYKGLDLLLEAMQFVKDPNIKILIAGEYYDDPQKYAALLQHPAVAGRILLHANFVSNEDVKYFVCASDCVIQPYRSATQSGVTPVAYHFEIPMIVTNVGGLPEMVPHEKAGLVCSANPPAIASAIEQYFPPGKAFFMPGLLEEKKKLSWQKLVANIIE